MYPLDSEIFSYISCRKYYEGADACPSPHKYVEFPEPKLESLDVRLLAFLLSEEQGLAEAAIAAARHIFQSIPEGTATM